jgi:hypothetical protein
MGFGGMAGVGIPGIGGLGGVNTAGLNKRANSMSAILVPVFFIVAIIIGFIFDIIFSFVSFPFSRYIWYATTAVPFALAGMLGALWTKSGKGLVIGIAVGASLMYGGCDMGLGVAMGGQGMGLFDFAFLAAFSIGISLFAGIGGAIRGGMQKDALLRGQQG